MQPCLVWPQNVLLSCGNGAYDAHEVVAPGSMLRIRPVEIQAFHFQKGFQRGPQLLNDGRV